MFASVLFATLASMAVAAPVKQQRDSAPVGWATGYLENYDTYHTRYLALDCQDKHNTTFFDECCHPLLANENLTADRPSYCAPNATEVSSASAYEATATSTDSAEADVATQYESATASLESVWSSVAAATSTSAVANAQAQVAAAPTTTSTSEWVAPTTAAATTTAASSGGQVMTGGYATFFYQGGNPGECGTVHSDSDKVIAIDANGWWSDYQSNDNSPYCGKYITITNTNNGKSVTAMVADVCPTCTTDNSLDLSVGAFTAIASEGDGMVPITWVWA